MFWQMNAEKCTRLFNLVKKKVRGKSEVFFSFEDVGGIIMLRFILLASSASLIAYTQHARLTV